MQGNTADEFEAYGLLPVAVSGPDEDGHYVTDCPCGAGMVRLGRPVAVTYPWLAYYACHGGHTWMYVDRAWRAATAADASRLEALYRERYGDPEQVAAEGLPGVRKAVAA